MEKISLQPYIVTRQSELLSDIASTSANPATSDLLQLEQELKSISSELVTRKAKLKSDEEKLKNWKSKAKGKEKAQSSNALAATASGAVATNGSNINGTPQSNQANADNKALQRIARESSLSSSPDLSETEAALPRNKRGQFETKRKRKRQAIEDSDEDYSEPEIILNEAKSRKTIPQPPSSSKVNGLVAPPPPSNHAKQKTASPAPSTPIATQTAEQSPAPIPPQSQPMQQPQLSASASAPSLKLKLSTLSAKKSNSGTPPPSVHPSIQMLPPTKYKSQPGVANDFSLYKRSLVPAKPTSIPPEPLPKRQVDVTEDFSKIKVGTQTPFNTFLTYLEPYLRNFADDDVAFLSQKTDDLTPYLIPTLGRHYSEWNDDDSNPATALDPPALERFRAEDLTEDKLPTEHVYMGPLSERLISAMSTKPLVPHAVVNGDDGETQPQRVQDDIVMNETQDNASGLSENSTIPQPPEIVAPTDSTSNISTNPAQVLPVNAPAPMDAIELEERIRKELRFLGVFPPNPQGTPGNRARDGEIDWSARTDDEISSELKACQRLLSEQMSVNDATKARLVVKVKDRMARQEFETMRDALEKTIESGYLKRQRMIKKKPIVTSPGKPTAEAKSSAAEGAVVSTATSSTAPLPDELILALERRRKLVDGVMNIFQSAADPERYFGVPTKDDEVVSQTGQI